MPSPIQLKNQENNAEPTSSTIRSEPVFSELIKSINDRLENLGRESELSTQKMFQEMTAKITDLENSMKSHQDKTGSLIQKILKTNANMESEKSSVLSSEEGSPSLMGTMFGRMFRL
jgi:uncharacterized coiled-coil protein SlyX